MREPYSQLTIQMWHELDEKLTAIEKELEAGEARKRRKAEARAAALERRGHMPLWRRLAWAIHPGRESADL